MQKSIGTESQGLKVISLSLIVHSSWKVAHEFELLPFGNLLHPLVDRPDLVLSLHVENIDIALFVPDFESAEVSLTHVDSLFSCFSFTLKSLFCWGFDDHHTFNFVIKFVLLLLISFLNNGFLLVAEFLLDFPPDVDNLPILDNLLRKFIQKLLLRLRFELFIGFGLKSSNLLGRRLRSVFLS